MSLILFGTGCVNLDKPATVETCGSVGTCRNSKDAGTPNDTAVNPDGDMVLPVDALNPDAAMAVDTLVAVTDTNPVSADSKTNTIPSNDAPSDTFAVDMQSPGRTDAEVINPDSSVVKTLDTGASDTTPIPVDVHLDTLPVSDTSKDLTVPIDASPIIDAESQTFTFSAGRGTGAMTGYGWVSLGTADRIDSPTCLGNVAITGATPCLSSTIWNASNALCITGYVPALIMPTPDYDGNWGVQVGVSASEPTASIGVSHKTITLDVTGAPQTNLRALIHRFGESGTYCYLMTPGVPIPLTSFNTKCWEQPSSGVTFTEADAAKIDWVSVQVSSTTAGNIAVTNLCLNSIVFGN